nr:hypothetical protein [Tanacetum cinerariifolium]
MESLVDEAAMISVEAEHIAATGCCAKYYENRKAFTRSPNMYREYLAEFWYLAQALEKSKVHSTYLTLVNMLHHHRLMLLGSGLLRLGHDVSTNSTAKADPVLSAPYDSIPPQQALEFGKTWEMRI